MKQLICMPCEDTVLPSWHSFQRLLLSLYVCLRLQTCFIHPVIEEVLTTTHSIYFYAEVRKLSQNYPCYSSFPGALVMSLYEAAYSYRAVVAGDVKTYRGNCRDEPILNEKKMVLFFFKISTEMLYFQYVII